MAALASNWPIHFRLNRIQVSDKKQDLNVYYQVCVFRADRKNKMAVLASDLLDIFNFSYEIAEPNSITLTGSKISTSSTKFVFSAVRKNMMAALASDWLRHFQLLLRNC